MMKSIDIIPMIMIHGADAKARMDELLKSAYIHICTLRSMSLNKTLNTDYIQEVESLFLANQFSKDDLRLPKYLKKYAQCINNYWHSYTFYNGMISKGKFDLFRSLLKNDLVQKDHYSESEFAKIIRRMEDCWTASSQLYTQYEISLVKKSFLR